MGKKRPPTVREAAQKLGMDRETLTTWIRSGRCPFGEYIKGEGNTRGMYYINAFRLTVYLKAKDMILPGQRTLFEEGGKSCAN